jgi:hypothetical protein
MEKGLFLPVYIPDDPEMSVGKIRPIWAPFTPDGGKNVTHSRKTVPLFSGIGQIARIRAIRAIISPKNVSL